jgi:TonB family protein
MDLKTNQKNKFISGISTAIICMGMFLIFWLYNFHYELEKPIEPEDGAVAVSLGEPDNGGPDLIPISAESEASSASSPQSADANEQTIDQDAVATKKASETKGQSQAAPTDKPKPVDDALAALNRGKSTQKQQNAGDGDKLGPQGDPKGVNGGDPKGQVGGTGSGPTGTTHSFSGRNFRLGSGKNNCNEEGKVVLEVTLLPDGRIRYDNVSPLSRASSCLENVAVNYIRSSSFNAATNPISVEGTITFTFKLK